MAVVVVVVVVVATDIICAVWDYFIIIHPFSLDSMWRD